MPENLTRQCGKLFSVMVFLWLNDEAQSVPWLNDEAQGASWLNDEAQGISGVSACIRKHHKPVYS